MTSALNAKPEAFFARFCRIVARSNLLGLRQPRPALASAKA
jgi:hypothetical protein